MLADLSASAKGDLLLGQWIQLSFRREWLIAGFEEEIDLLGCG